MAEAIEVNQTAAPISNSTQIGIQYIGMSPEQASKQTIDLFMENFPKLQTLAQETAYQKATELCNDVLKKLEDRCVKDFTPFADPDVQYVLYEAQKHYARFGNKQNMDILSELIVSRIQNDKRSHFKMIVDNAIPVACELSSVQLDYLSALFLLTRVHQNQINNIESLKNSLSYISNTFGLKRLTYGNEISFLYFMGCLQIQLPNIAEIQSKEYKIPEDQVKAIISEDIDQFSTDYGISEIGTILAIINAEKKSSYKLNPHIWIFD